MVRRHAFLAVQEVAVADPLLCKHHVASGCKRKLWPELQLQDPLAIQLPHRKYVDMMHSLQQIVLMETTKSGRGPRMFSVKPE